jgi:hypothetical protein
VRTLLLAAALRRMSPAHWPVCQLLLTCLPFYHLGSEESLGLGHQRLNCQEHGGNRSGILQRPAGHLGRVGDAG